MLNIDLVFRNLTASKSPKEIFFKKILEIAAKEQKLRGRIEVSVNLVEEKKIQELNNKYRGKNKSTDVLSFPLDEKKMANYDIIPLGDIFICHSVAKLQAKEEKISTSEEMARLTIHGFLHLLGYDHERSAKEEKKMINLQEKILKKITN